MDDEAKFHEYFRILEVNLKDKKKNKNKTNTKWSIKIQTRRLKFKWTNLCVIRPFQVKCFNTLHYF